MTAPFRIGTVWRAALGDLIRHRGATAVACAGAGAAALAGRLALQGALAWALPASTALPGGGSARRAVAALLLGGAVALLGGAVTRAAALCSYGGSSAWSGIGRAPALLAIELLELILYATLAAAGLLLAARLPHFGSAAAAALFATLLLVPPLVVVTLIFCAARVAQALVARGLPLGEALEHGCDFTLRAFPALTRLFGSAPLVCLPLVIVAAALPFPLQAALLATAALWTYAALIRLVGADARLAWG